MNNGLGVMLSLAVGSVVALGARAAAQSSDAGESATREPVARPFVAAAPRGEGPLFTELVPEQTGVDFQLQLPEVLSHIRQFTLLSIYGGLCTGDYDGDGLTDFYVTSPVGGNRLYRNLGDFRFEDVTVSAGVHDPDMLGTGATFADVDNDGDLDLYACAYDSPNRLFLNQGADPKGVKFVEAAAKLGLAFKGASTTMSFADIDGDGDLDGYLCTTSIDPPPGEKFSVNTRNGRPEIDAAGAEYWELLYLSRSETQRIVAGQFDRLYRNDGQRFTEITRQAGVTGPYFTLGAVWWDYDEDGRPDLHVANDFLGPDRLYRNAGDGRFENVAAAGLPVVPFSSMGADMGDVNNDGRVDLFATEMSARRRARRVMMSGAGEDADVLRYHPSVQEMRNMLFLNSGAGRMFEAARQYGVDSTDWTWNPRLADFDNDGFLDLFVSTGMLRDMMNTDIANYTERHVPPGSDAWCRFWAGQPMLREPNIAMKNAAGRRFEDVSATWGLDRVGVSYGAATADFDNDGDLDLVVSNADAPLSIYRNNAGGNSIRLELRGTTSNRFGLGATITCETAGRRQAAYLTLSRGWLSALEPAVHFGLDDAAQADAVTIRWPSGRIQRLENLSAGHTYTIIEPLEDPLAAANVGGPASQ
jgi:hypothetical protein